MERPISTDKTTDGAIGSSLDYFKRLGSPIVAPATASGGPVSVIRVSGKNLEFLRKVTGDLPHPGTFALRQIKDTTGERMVYLDRSLVLYFKAPHSFTGEDVVEIHCHGVPVLIERICRLIESWGARSALPGEFSFRAVLNEKMTLEEAEGLQSALTLDGLQVESASQLLGAGVRNSEAVSIRLADAILKAQMARGRVEAAIDFPEAEAEQAAELSDALRFIDGVRDSISRLLSAYQNFCLTSGEARVAIVGSPNVGKSTLFNLLCGGQRAIVSNVPGTTRDVLESRVRLPSGRWVRMLDTAGIRDLEAKSFHSEHESLEAIGIQLGLDAMKLARVVIYVERASERTLSAEVRLGGAVLPSENFVRLQSHADELPVDLRSVNDFDFREEGERVCRHVLSSIEETLRAQESMPDSLASESLISSRQEKLLLSAVSEVDLARQAVLGGIPIELAGLHLREAESWLKKSIGRDVGEEYIGQIFSQFCLGK